jgi:hypothetical protein
MVRSELNRNDKSMELGKKLYGKIGTGVLLSMILIDKTEKFSRDWRAVKADGCDEKVREQIKMFRDAHEVELMDAGLLG